MCGLWSGEGHRYIARRYPRKTFLCAFALSDPLAVHIRTRCVVQVDSSYNTGVQPCPSLAWEPARWVHKHIQCDTVRILILWRRGCDFYHKSRSTRCEARSTGHASNNASQRFATQIYTSSRHTTRRSVIAKGGWVVGGQVGGGGFTTLVASEL